MTDHPFNRCPGCGQLVLRGKICVLCARLERERKEKEREEVAKRGGAE